VTLKHPNLHETLQYLEEQALNVERRVKGKKSKEKNSTSTKEHNMSRK